ncbi:methyltransferase domain-containing protein, partial [Cryobacterium sp. 5B3]
IDVVDEMLEASRKNFVEAEQVNPWFKSEFVELRKGDALHLPVEDSSIDVAAQNCLFNIFKEDELKQALKEMYRVLKPTGRL